MNISKLEAARRQMDCAIGLYFAERDEVSIHTSVGAAYLVLSDLSKAAKKDSPIDQYVKLEHRGKFEGAIRASQNFFEHADRGSEAALLDFNPHETELLLFIDVERFGKLSGASRILCWHSEPTPPRLGARLRLRQCLGSFWRESLKSRPPRRSPSFSRFA